MTKYVVYYDGPNDGTNVCGEGGGSADDEGVVIAGRRIPYADIERARTTFTWGSPAKPMSKNKKAS